MSDVPSSFPDDGQVFEGRRDERYLALALERTVHDMSPIGDGAVATRIGRYAIGAGEAPEGIPEYVELDDGSLALSNPPFLLAEIDVDGNGAYRLDVRLDSELNLLIEPPVVVSFDGSLGEVVGALEQMFAEIYRTRGRRLEMIDAGTFDPDAFSDRR